MSRAIIVPSQLKEILYPITRLHTYYSGSLEYSISRAECIVSSLINNANLALKHLIYHAGEQLPTTNSMVFINKPS